MTEFAYEQFKLMCEVTTRTLNQCDDITENVTNPMNLNDRISLPHTIYLNANSIKVDEDVEDFGFERMKVISNCLEEFAKHNPMYEATVNEMYSFRKIDALNTIVIKITELKDKEQFAVSITVV